MRSSNGVAVVRRGRSHGSIAPARRSVPAFGVWIGAVSEVSISDIEPQRLHARRPRAADARHHSETVFDDVRHGVDQCKVSEGLREVAEMATASRVELLGVEVKRRGMGEQMLTELAGALGFTDL